MRIPCLLSSHRIIYRQLEIKLEMLNTSLFSNDTPRRVAQYDLANALLPNTRCSPAVLGWCCNRMRALRGQLLFFARLRIVTRGH